MSYSRIFGKTQNDFGRLYSTFSNLPKKMRQVLIDDYDLEELDYSNFNLNLFFLIETGKKYNGDIYTAMLKSLDERFFDKYPNQIALYRKIFKTIMLLYIGSDEKTIQKAVTYFLVNKGIYKKVYDDEKKDKFFQRKFIKFAESVGYKENSSLYPIRKKYSFKQVHKAVMEICEPIRYWIMNSKTNVAQNLESKCIIDVAKKIIEKGGSLPLLIHDAALVKKDDSDRIKDEMEKILLEKSNEYRNKILEMYGYENFYNLTGIEKHIRRMNVLNEKNREEKHCEIKIYQKNNTLSVIVKNDNENKSLKMKISQIKEICNILLNAKNIKQRSIIHEKDYSKFTFTNSNAFFNRVHSMIYFIESLLASSRKKVKWMNRWYRVDKESRNKEEKVNIVKWNSCNYFLYLERILAWFVECIKVP